MTVKYHSVEPDPIIASISSDGILTWKEYPGAVRYMVGVNGYYHIAEGQMADIKALAQETYSNEINKDFKNTGTIEVELQVYKDISKGYYQNWKGKYGYTAKKHFSLSYIEPTGYLNEVTYTGNAITFDLIVKTIYGTELEEDKDYTVQYQNNIKTGTATIILTGKGIYDGTIKIPFKIIESAPSAAALTKGTPQSSAEALLASVKANKDPVGTEFGKLQLRVSKTAAKKLTLKWKKISGAAKYVMYGNVAGKKPFKKLAEIKKSKAAFTKKSLKPGKWYKLLLIAYDQKGDVLSASKTVYAATTGGKYTNPAKLSTAAKKNKVSVKVKKTFKLKAKAAKASAKRKMKTYRKIRYESSDPTIAAVSGKGVIKGKKKGSCYVYAYAQNGVFQKIKVTVKK